MRASPPTISAETRLQPGVHRLALYMRRRQNAVVKRTGHAVCGEPSGVRGTTAMKKLPTAALAITAALVALLPVLSKVTGGYGHEQSRDRYEIAINLSDLVANRESAANPRPVNYEEPA